MAKEIQYSYDDYRYSIIMAAEQLSMNKSFNWFKHTFNDSMDNLLVSDETLTERIINDLFNFFIKFNKEELIVKLMSNKNVTKVNIKLLIPSLNFSSIDKTNFYINLFKLDLWVDNNNIDSAFIQGNLGIDIAMLLNKRVTEEYPLITYTILKTATYPENIDNLPIIKEHVLNTEFLLPFTLKLHETDGITDFLPTEITDIFLF